MQTIVLAAIRNNPKALQFAGQRIQGSKRFVLEAVSVDPKVRGREDRQGGRCGVCTVVIG